MATGVPNTKGAYFRNARGETTFRAFAGTSCVIPGLIGKIESAPRVNRYSERVADYCSYSNLVAVASRWQKPHSRPLVRVYPTSPVEHGIDSGIFASPRRIQEQMI